MCSPPPVAPSRGQVESAASSAVKTACDISAKAIIVLSETGETARYVAKFHPESPIICVMADARIGKQIEGYMCNTKSLIAEVPRGDGNHVKWSFAEGMKKGLFSEGDAVVCVHTTRNSEDVKQFMVRILFVTSGDPRLHEKVDAGAAEGPASKRARK